MAVEKQPLPGAVVHYCIAYRSPTASVPTAAAMPRPCALPRRNGLHRKTSIALRGRRFELSQWTKTRFMSISGSEKGLLRSDRTSSSLRGDGNTSQSSPAMSRQGRFMRATKGAAHPCRWHLPVKCIPIRPQVARHRAHRDSRRPLRRYSLISPSARPTAPTTRAHHRFSAPAAKFPVSPPHRTCPDCAHRCATAPLRPHFPNPRPPPLSHARGRLQIASARPRNVRARTDNEPDIEHTNTPPNNADRPVVAPNP